MADITMKTIPSSSIEFVEPEEGMFVTYANNLGVGFTPADLRLIFGEVIDYKDGKTTVEQRAQVTVSWLHAKILHSWLGLLIERHEAALGPITVPSELMELIPR